MKCFKCESTNVREINLEMAFARGKAAPVYAAGRPVVCLECGFVDISVAQDALVQLRDGASPQYSMSDFDGYSARKKSCA